MDNQQIDNEELLENLTEKQKIFCREYIFDWNASRAARVAGYSENSIRSIASETLAKPYIKAYIEHIQKNLEQTSGLSKLRILREHEKMAFSSIAHLHDTWIERKEFDKLTDDQKSCIAEISTQIRKSLDYTDPENPQPVDVEFIKVKLYDKQKSLDSIAKMLGYNEPEKISVLTPVKSFTIEPASKGQ